MRRCLTVLLLCTVVAAPVSAGSFRARSASAHAVLLRSDPRAGVALQDPPKHIQLWFSEGLSRDLTTVRLLDSNGQAVGRLQLMYNDADDRQVSASVPDLPKGAYVIAWSSFSSVDGHRLDGSVSFGVGVAPTGAGSTTSSPDFSPSGWEVAARWLALIGAIAVGGIVTIALIIGGSAERERSPRRLLVWLALGGFGLLGAGDVATLLLRADRAGGLGESWTIVTGSTWGQLWLARMNLVVFGTGATLAMLISIRRWFTTRMIALACVAVAILLTESLSSHAATRTSNLPVFADFLHIVASSAWIGTVLGLPALLLWSRRDPSRRALVARTVGRFAFVAAACFGVILITGVYRTVQEMPRLRSFVDTTYGKTLTVKLALVLAMLTLGATNFFLARTWDRRRTSRIWGMFTRSVPVEAVVGASILVAVALMTLATPAASFIVPGRTAELAKISSVVTQQGTADDLTVVLTVQPSAEGQRISAALKRNGNASSSSKPLLLGEGLAITQVRFRFKPLAGSVGESRTIASKTGDDQQGDETYAVEGQFLPFKGRWGVDVDVRRKDADDASAKFTIDTEQANRPAYVRTLLDHTIVYSVARASGTPGLLLAAGGEFYQSTDAGATWKSLGGSGAYHVIADPTSPAGFFAAGPAGLLRTDDAGVSWQTLYWVKDDAVSDIVQDRVDPHVLVIATEKGIFQSADAGATWELRLPSAPAGAPASQPNQWSRLATAPDGTIVTGRRPGVMAVSHDRGSTWRELRSNLNLPGGVMGLMIDSANPQRWFVGSMGSGVWVSDDAGASWQQVKNGVSPSGHGAGFATTPGGKVIVATTGQGVLITSDGTSWSQVGDDGIDQGIAEGVALVAVPGGGHALIVAGIGLYRLELPQERETTHSAAH